VHLANFDDLGIVGIEGINQNFGTTSLCPTEGKVMAMLKQKPSDKAIASAAERWNSL